MQLAVIAVLLLLCVGLAIWVAKLRKRLTTFDIAMAMDEFDSLLREVASKPLDQLHGKLVEGKYFDYVTSTQTNLRGELSLHVTFKHDLFAVLYRYRAGRLNEVRQVNDDLYEICVTRRPYAR